MSGEIVEGSSRPLLSQRLARSPLGAKENFSSTSPIINSQTCLEKLSKSGSRPLLSQRLARSPLAVAFYNS